MILLLYKELSDFKYMMQKQKLWFERWSCTEVMQVQLWVNGLNNWGGCIVYFPLGLMDYPSWEGPRLLGCAPERAPTWMQGM